MTLVVEDTNFIGHRNAISLCSLDGQLTANFSMRGFGLDDQYHVRQFATDFKSCLFLALFGDIVC